MSDYVIYVWRLERYSFQIDIDFFLIVGEKYVLYHFWEIV